ncbi:Uncharacterised protein [Klebsiella pneumoniae]|uniref:Uncharacterized protein n=1 Tax=Klebsiella pneumoniae TaxID=573 RepID=A0A377XR43_KLEPN|nr:Uncharacterised protein [Klebsiella pneumoniae]
MMSFIKRALLWLFQQLISLYAPHFALSYLQWFFFKFFLRGRFGLLVYSLYL